MSTTPNMNLTLPVVGTTPEEEWAEILNEALEDVDAHDHTSGNGVRITPAAIHINDDLQLNSFSLTEVNAVYLNDLDADLTARGIYAKDGNLFYYNTDGDAVQITNGDSIAGTSGSITGLSSPAGAAFSSLTNAFSWTYDSSKHAKSAHGDLQLFPYDGSTAYTKSVTVKAPTTLEAATSFSLTLPSALPASGTEYLSIDSSGVVNHATLVGTTDQVNVSASATAIALSLPQSIATTSSPTFAGLTVSATAAVQTLTASSAVYSAAGTAVAPAISFTGDQNTGFYSAGADQLGVTTGGANIATFSADGLNIAAGGAFKVKIFTGTVAASATVDLDVGSGWVAGYFGRYGVNLSGDWSPMSIGTTAGSLYFSLSSQASDTVRIINANSGNTMAYYITVFYV